MTETARRGLPASGTSADTDPTLTDLPLLPRERIWGFWQHSSVNVGLAIATWAFLQGAAVAYYVGLAQAIATIIIGYGLSVLAVALAPCMPSVKYGIEQFVGLRSTFGEIGARVVMVAVSTVLAAAWSAVLAIMFGHGIVTTVEDFGIKGEPPTHPELLDWLAVTFMENGWSMKKTLRLIATSATFCQDAALTPELIEKDDANHLYARGPRFRLDAEGIRDNALAIAGLLSTEKGGPPIYPPQPDGLWRKVGGQNYKYEVSPGEKKYRRGLYVVLKRGAPYPSFVNFDASARMACVVSRSRSNTPLQALTLLNDPVYVEAAQAFAARVLKEKPNTPLDDQLTHAFRLAIARSPAASELTILHNLFQTQRDNGADEGAAWFAVTSALLNLDECITRN